MTTSTSTVELDCGAVLNDRGQTAFFNEIPASPLSSPDIYTLISLLESPSAVDASVREHVTNVLSANARVRSESDFRPGEREFLQEWFDAVGADLRFRQERPVTV